MTLSLALQQKGFNVIIVDPKSVKDLISTDKRTTAVAEGPKNFYDSLGVWEKVKKYAEPIKIINIKDGNSKIDLNFNCNTFKEIKNINNLGHVIENSHLLRGINTTIKNNKNIGSIKRIKAKVVSIDSDNFSSKVTLSNNKNKRDPTVAKMWVYALEFKESNKNNKIWTFLVAHTSHLPIRALVMEVFKEGNTSSKNLKEITLNLFSNKGGILKYLNLSIVDDFKKSDEIMEKFVHHFSERIVKY